MTHNSVIDIYTVPLIATHAQYEYRKVILSLEEQSRAARFRFERDRIRWTNSRAALRLILAHHLDLPATDISFTLRPGGKPEVAMPDCGKPVERTSPDTTTESSTSLQFNLSHSRDRALIAVSDTLEIGCDIEYTKRINDWPAVAKRFFSAAEQQELAQVDADQQSFAFFLCWTRKEAVIKATGEGLRADLGAFDVSLTPGSATTVKSDRRPEHSDSAWHLHNVRLNDGYVGAVAARTDCTPHINCINDWQFDDGALQDQSSGPINDSA